MGAIVPALLVKDANELKEKLAKIDGVVTDIQIDAVDGKFASPSSWPHTEASIGFTQCARQEKILPCCNKFRIESDLMVTNLTKSAIAWSAVGASRLVLHATNMADIESTLSNLEKHFGYEKNSTPNVISIGVALTVEDSLESLDPIINRINFVQYMGIDHIGLQGEPFDERVPNLVRLLRSRYPDMPIQVDGGVSLKTAPALLIAGVHRLIIGSAIWKARDVAERIHEFEDMVQQYGIYES